MGNIDKRKAMIDEFTMICSSISCIEFGDLTHLKTVTTKRRIKKDLKKFRKQYGFPHALNYKFLKSVAKTWDKERASFQIIERDCEHMITLFEKVFELELEND